jgi:hypothetical protein
MTKIFYLFLAASGRISPQVSGLSETSSQFPHNASSPGTTPIVAGGWNAGHQRPFIRPINPLTGRFVGTLSPLV